MGSTLNTVQTDDTTDGLLQTDTSAHSGRYNMAVDEQQLELAMIPVFRSCESIAGRSHDFAGIFSAP